MAKVSAQGCKLQVTISAVLTDIPQLVSISPPGVERRFKDTTTLDSSGNFTEYTPLKNDTSEAGGEGFWDPDNSTHDFLMDQAMLATGVLDVWAIVYSNSGASVQGFSGFVQRFQPTVQADDVLGFQLSIRVSGAVTYTQ